MLSSASIASRRLPSLQIRQKSTSKVILRALKITQGLRSFDSQQPRRESLQLSTNRQKEKDTLPPLKIRRQNVNPHLIRKVTSLSKEIAQEFHIKEKLAAEKSAVEANMTEMQKIHTDKAFPVAAPYSQAIVAGGTIYVSGQIPGGADGKLVEGNIGDKTAACCKNIIAILEAAGSSIERVVKVNIFLDDMANFKEMNETYGVYFAHKPARSCVAVKALPLGVPVEIECIALAGKGSSL